MAIVSVLISVLLVYFKFVSVHTTTSDKFINLCVKNDSNVGYSEYNTLKASSCDCEDSKRCIRKCCQFGFSHNFTRDDNKDGRCIRNDNIVAFNNFSVILYKGTVKSSETNVFLIGMLNCNNTNMIYQYFKFNHSDPNEKYFLQTDGTLYYPHSRRKFYKNDRFCVDEGDGLSVYLCYTPDSPQRQVLRMVNSTGIKFSKFFLS